MMIYIFKMIKMLENNFNQIKATGTLIRWMLFLFSLQKRDKKLQRIYFTKNCHFVVGWYIFVFFKS